MGRIKDFIAKWQTIERPDWNREKDEQQTKLVYGRELSDEGKEAVIEKEDVREKDAGHKVKVIYDELKKDEHIVYALFEDSESEERVHLEEFEHRKDAKDRLEQLLDEYSQLNS